MRSLTKRRKRDLVIVKTSERGVAGGKVCKLLRTICHQRKLDDLSKAEGKFD